jgi:hypothetical protein
MRRTKIAFSAVRTGKNMNMKEVLNRSILLRSLEALLLHGLLPRTVPTTVTHISLCFAFWRESAS